MAIRKTPKENLLRDGKNFLYRGEVLLNDTKVVVGFRRHDQIALYCGEDPVFQFNSEPAIRRVYFKDGVYRAESRQLVRLVRSREVGRVAFCPEPLDHLAEQEVFRVLEFWASRIEEAIDEPGWSIVGEESSRFRDRLRGWFKRFAFPPLIAEAPNVL